MILFLFLSFVFLSILMSSSPKEAFSLFSMIKIKDDPIGLMQESLIIIFPLRLTFLIIGLEKFDEAPQILVEIVKRVGLVTGKILSHDETPFALYGALCAYRQGPCSQRSHIAGDYAGDERRERPLS